MASPWAKYLKSFSRPATFTSILLSIFIYHGMSTITRHFHLPPLPALAVNVVSVAILSRFPGIPFFIITAQLIFLTFYESYPVSPIPVGTIIFCSLGCLVSFFSYRLFVILYRPVVPVSPSMEYFTYFRGEVFTYFFVNGVLIITRMSIALVVKNVKDRDRIELVCGIVFLSIGVASFVIYDYLYVSWIRERDRTMPVSVPVPVPAQVPPNEEDRGGG